MPSCLLGSLASWDMTTNDPTARRAVSRRWVLSGLAATAVATATAACGSDDTTTTTTGTSSTTASTTPTTAASATATGAAKAGSVAALAQAFCATLDADQLATTLLDYSLADAKRWSNLPQALIAGGGMGGGPGGDSTGSSSGSSGGRVGLSIGDLSEKQSAAFEALLEAATGTKAGLGYDQIQQHLDADDYLAENGGGSDYGRANYYVAILGSPQDSGTWEFQFGGHHLAVANTYIDGTLAGATPSFRGIEPNAAFTWEGQTDQPMKVKEAAFVAMLASLTSDQASTAQLGDVYSDLVLGPGNDWAFPDEKAGIKVSELSSRQQKLVLAAIATYVEDIADDDAATILATYRQDLGDTYLAYSGTTTLAEQNDYVRIDGPSVWIEYSMQHGIVLSGNHPHTVWRDRTTDYGGTKS